MALSQLVNQIVGLSSAADLDNLNSTLKQSQTDAVLRQNAGGILEAVSNLDYATHSLGCLYLLEARGRTSNSTQGDRDFFNVGCAFLLACTHSHIQKAPQRFVSLCRQIKTHAKALDKAKHAILPLRSAIVKLSTDQKLLTPIHGDLFELCLLAKCYSAAQPVLQSDVTTVDPSRSCTTATDVLLYCYYGGMVATGLRNYTRALELLLMAITAPTLVLNAITIAALKKYILVSLIHLGQLPGLPKHTAQLVSRALKSECGPYMELVKLVAGDTTTETELSTFVASKLEAFSQDGNVGLVKLVISSTPTRRIQRLTSTYLTLSLDAVAAQAGLSSADEAEKAILGMIADGKIFAEIDSIASMVRFLDNPEAYNTEAAAAKIDGLIRQSQALVKELEEVNHAVACDRSYINKTELKGGGGGMSAHHLLGGGNGGGGKMRVGGEMDIPMLEDFDGLQADSFND